MLGTAQEEAGLQERTMGTGRKFCQVDSKVRQMCVQALLHDKTFAAFGKLRNLLDFKFLADLIGLMGAAAMSGSGTD